ncbi:MAG TPA: A/G-specific adenine glycosylase, partial [Spirochaetales bacterium]|nr:A/G-specific adenine glycosylase [Spirochaetales bacterium]
MTKTVPDSDASEFRHAVLERYRLHGRSFPWRETQDPWAILVSEVMLQQTQTARVVKPYIQWMEQWPTAASLADANLSDLYQAWSGLGYNSRAMRLRDSARLLCSEYGGKVP